MSEARTRFEIRQIKKGKVKIGGITYAPMPCPDDSPYKDQYPPYDGQLDGISFAFSVYRDFDKSGEPIQSELIALWGTASDFYNHNPEFRDPIELYNKWMIWEAEN